MGQYHVTCNFEKREFIHPHDLGMGLKQLEQIGFDGSTGDVIFMLLSCSNERGGGDFTNVDGLLGRWAGDRVAVVGDYAEDSDLPPFLHAGRVYDDCYAWDDWHKAGQPADLRTYVMSKYEDYAKDATVMQYMQDMQDCLSDPTRRWTNISDLLLPLIAKNCRIKIQGTGCKERVPV